MPLEGKQIGRYRFERLIGRGAMGEVYLAVDPRIRQQVAVKVLQAEPSVYPARNVAREAERFRSEASAIANLRHPHIVPLYDYNETSVDEALMTYLVLPYYQEGSFASWLRRRGSDFVPMEDVVYFVQQAADALQYAHNHQVIHRDVKPSNFLIESGENPNRPNLLLADFGISKFALGTTNSATQSVGTLSYMPPEQLQGRPTYASDQYALAIMAYELLVGHPPFEGPPPAVIHQHMEVQPRPPSMLNPGLPRTIDYVLLRALEKRPEHRYPTISAFARALQQALPVDSSSPTRANTLHEPGQSDLHAALVISEAEALMGTKRILTLPGGRQVPVSVPAGTQDGQIIRLEGQVGLARDRDAPGALILTITIAPPEERASLSDATAEATVISSGSVPGSKGAAELAPPSRTTDSTETRNRRRGLKTILLAGLALLVAVGGSVGVFYFTRSHQQNPYPSYGTLALDDPLSDNSHGYNWRNSDDSLGRCAFTGGAYHVNALQQGSNHYCIASPNFSNFVYQVQMTIVKGFAGGIIFRADYARGNFYLFGIGQDGGYQLDSVNNSNFQILRTRGSGTATNAGLNQSILLAVVAKGSTIEVYVNNKKIDSVNESSYTQGQIGVFESDLNGNGTTEVVFSNAKVWT